MKIKPLAYFLFFLVLVTSVVYFTATAVVGKKNQHWQLLIEKQVGTISTLNVGKNLTFDESSIYFSDVHDTIYSVNKTTGQVQWQSTIGNHSPFQLTVDKNAVYVSSFDSHIYKIDKKNGYIEWSFAIPNQFWPDTEVIADNTTPLVFFADRAGILRALNRETGQVAWQKEFGSIDNSRAFTPNSIHFGFLSQNEDQLIVDHFPSQTIFKVDKATGKTTNQSPSSLQINWPEYKTVFKTNTHSITMNNNVAHQPSFVLTDNNQHILWTYQTTERINEREIYQDGDRIYYFDATNRVLTSLAINGNEPSNQNLKKLNFKIIEDFSTHHPFKGLAKQHNQQVDFIVQTSLVQKIKNWLLKTKLRVKYVVSNYNAIQEFLFTQQEQKNYLEITINHDQNFYRNPFTQIAITAEFTNQKTNQVLNVKGFYYDHNTWKVRAKLDAGQWQWQIKIKTPLATKQQNGEILIEKTESTTTNKDLDDHFFLGIQDTIFDQNMDGNPLNQMGYAATTVPAINQEDYQYLSFSEYLELYKNEAGINLFRYGPDNWAPSIWENLASPNNFSMNINGNLQGDIIVNEAKSKDIRVIMTIFGFYPPYTSIEALANKNNQKVIQKYLDYVIARYAATVDVWELANEALPSLDWLNFVSNYLAKNDPYQRTITTNLEETRLNHSELLSIHVYIHPKNNKELIQTIEKLLNQPKLAQNWQKPIMISEFGFKGANHFNDSAELLRKTAWIAAFQKTSVVFWNTGLTLFENADNANVYLGPKERFFLKNLQEFLATISLPTTNNMSVFENNSLATYTLENEEVKAFYFLNLAEKNKNQHQLPREFFIPNSTTETIIEFIDPSHNKTIQTIAIDQNTDLIQLPSFTEDLAARIYLKRPVKNEQIKQQ